MHDSSERDRSMEPLLRRSLRADPGEETAACLDAETIAAFVDGGLRPPALTAAQTHLADCARCQALLASMARTQPVAVAEKPAASRGWLTWAVPLAAAVAVVAIWVAVPKQTGTPGTASVVSEPSAGTDATSFRDAGQQRSREAVPQAKPLEQPRAQSEQAKAANEFRREVDAFKSDNALTQAPAPPPPAPQPPATPPSAAASSAAAPPAGAMLDKVSPLAAARRADGATVEINSPDPRVRWRLQGPNLWRSTDGGAQWQPQTTGITSPLTAGSAASTSVVWLVGRGGMVLLSTDGQTWRRVPFPETVDLFSVRARDANSVSVTTSDGRTFSTTNAGATWDPRPLQDF